MLSKKAQSELLKFSRLVLIKYLETGKIINLEPVNQILQEKAGVFVTLTKNGELRGCIGNFATNKSIWESVKEMTLAAALEDPRFSPISKEELKDIKIEISVMSKKTKVKSYQEIIMGKHGVYLESGGMGGTFLPQVAKEFNNNRDLFLSSLCTNKAGLPADCYKNPQTNLYTYTCQVFSE